MLDILLLTLLPCRAGDRPTFQVGGPLHSLWLVTGLAERGHPGRVITTRPAASMNRRPVAPPRGVEVDWFAVDTLDMLSAPSAETVAPRRAQFEAALDRAM